jgi:predicted AAA+ superfamily ATPase
MSCYIRQLSDVFEALGVESNKDNRKMMDKFIRKLLKTDKPCPEVWKQLKTILADEKKKKELVGKLKKEFLEV